MSVAYVIHFTVRDDQRERFLRLLTDVLDAMAHEANYRGATLHEDPADPRRFLLHEVWADHDDVLEVQIHRPYRKDWHEALPELLDGDRRIEVWQPVASRRSLRKWHDAGSYGGKGVKTVRPLPGARFP